jgi:hypothetical protein
LATRAQRRNRDELAVCKHLVQFDREEDIMETAEEKTVEEEEGWMELAKMKWRTRRWWLLEWKMQ